MPTPAISPTNRARAARLGWSHDRDERVARLVEAGANARVVGSEIGVSVEVAQQIIRRLRLHRRLPARAPISPPLGPWPGP